MATSTSSQTLPSRPAPALVPPPWPGRKPAVPAALATRVRNTGRPLVVQEA